MSEPMLKEPGVLPTKSHTLMVRVWHNPVEFTAHCRCGWSTREVAFPVLGNRVEGHLRAALRAELAE